MTDPDPTTAMIVAQRAERDQLRAENDRLGRALVAAYTDVEVLKADRDRLAKIGHTLFAKGYDQAVREIKSHFAKAGQHEVAHEIAATWGKEKRS